MLTLANSKHKQERVKMHKMCEAAIAVLMRHLDIKLVVPLKCLKNAVFDVRMFLQINWPLLSCCCDQQRKHKKLWTMVFTGPFGKHKMNNILKNIVKIAKIPENETKRLKRKRTQASVSKTQGYNCAWWKCNTYHRTQTFQFNEQIQDTKRKQKGINVTNFVNHYWYTLCHS